MEENKGVFCTVQQCLYHQEGDKCTAEEIEVGSNKDCCASCDTECVTFKPQN